MRPTVELWLELETRCNLRCGFCYNYWKDGRQPPPRRATPADTMAALARLVDRVDCRQLAISGGEPLLLTWLDDLLALLKPHGFPMVLTTNGLLLTRQRAGDLVARGITAIQVPLHSHLEAVHDALSGGIRCWEHSIAALAAARENTPNVSAVCVLTQANLEHLVAVVEICAALDLRRVMANRFVPSGAGALNAEQLGVPTDAQLAAVLREADAVAARHGIRIELGVPVELPASGAQLTAVSAASCPVRAGQQRWSIGADLALRRCNHSAASIGTLLDGGIERLLDELTREADAEDPGNHRPCQFLCRSQPVAARPAIWIATST